MMPPAGATNTHLAARAGNHGRSNRQIFHPRFLQFVLFVFGPLTNRSRCSVGHRTLSACTAPPPCVGPRDGEGNEGRCAVTTLRPVLSLSTDSVKPSCETAHGHTHFVKTLPGARYHCCGRAMGIPRTTAAVGAAALVLKAAFEALPRAVDPQKARATPEVPLRQLDSTGATCSVLKNRRVRLPKVISSSFPPLSHQALTTLGILARRAARPTSGTGRPRLPFAAWCSSLTASPGTARGLLAWRPRSQRPASKFILLTFRRAAPRLPHLRPVAVPHS